MPHDPSKAPADAAPDPLTAAAPEAQERLEKSGFKLTPKLIEIASGRALSNEMGGDSETESSPDSENYPPGSYDDYGRDEYQTPDEAGQRGGGEKGEEWITPDVEAIATDAGIDDMMLKQMQGSDEFLRTLRVARRNTPGEGEAADSTASADDKTPKELEDDFVEAEVSKIVQKFRGLNYEDDVAEAMGEAQEPLFRTQYKQTQELDELKSHHTENSQQAEQRQYLETFHKTFDSLNDNRFGNSQDRSFSEKHNKARTDAEPHFFAVLQEHINAGRETPLEEIASEATARLFWQDSSGGRSGGSKQSHRRRSAGSRNSTPPPAKESDHSDDPVRSEVSRLIHIPEIKNFTRN